MTMKLVYKKHIYGILLRTIMVASVCILRIET